MLIEPINGLFHKAIKCTLFNCTTYYFPCNQGLFQAKLDHLYAQCAVENSHIFQSYMVCFTIILYHTI